MPVLYILHSIAQHILTVVVDPFPLPTCPLIFDFTCPVTSSDSRFHNSASCNMSKRYEQWLNKYSSYITSNNIHNSNYAYPYMQQTIILSHISLNKTLRVAYA